MQVRARHVLRVDRRLAFDSVERRAGASVEWQVVAEAGCLDAGHGANAIEQHAARDDGRRAGSYSRIWRGRWRNRCSGNADVKRQQRLAVEARMQRGEI